MREIKFRAWDTGYKRWEKPDGIGLDDGIAFSATGDGYIDDKITNYPEYVIQQYTGFTDRHGAEIYEEDILSGEFGKDTVELEEYHIDGGGTAICYVYSHSPLNQGLVDECDIEVIGNIYEDRELLDGGKE